MAHQLVRRFLWLDSERLVFYQAWEEPSYDPRPRLVPRSIAPAVEAWIFLPYGAVLTAFVAAGAEGGWARLLAVVAAAGLLLGLGLLGGQVGKSAGYRILPPLPRPVLPPEWTSSASTAWAARSRWWDPCGKAMRPTGRSLLPLPSGSACR